MVISPSRLEQINRIALFGGLLIVSAWLLAVLPLMVVAGALGMSLALFLLLRWPWLIWLGLAVILPVSSGIKVGPVSLTDVGLAAAVGLWFVDGVRRRTLRLEFSPVVIATLIYVGALLFSLNGALNLGEALAEVTKWVEVVVVLLVLRQMLPPRQLPWLVAALLLGGMAQALLGLYQFIFRIGPDWFMILGRFMRASGSFGQPNPYAGYLGLCLPVAASLALWSWNELRRQIIQNPPMTRHHAHWFWMLFYTGATALIGAGLLASWSRGGWLGALMGAAIIVTLRSRQALIGGVLGVLGLVVALLLGSAAPGWVPASVMARVQDIPAYFGLTDVINQPVNDDNFAVIERLAHWVAAVRMWEQAPWLGIGPGNYATVYPTVRLALWEEPLGHAHNIYLNVLAEGGLLGFSSYLLLWGVIIGWLWSSLSILRQMALSQAVGWSIALTIGLLGVVGHSLVHNFFDNIFVQGNYLQVAFWLAALTIAAPDQTHRGDL
jgi:putative inorganic carbon (hco3(-)) transporter